MARYSFRSIYIIKMTLHFDNSNIGISFPFELSFNNWFLYCCEFFSLNDAFKAVVQSEFRELDFDISSI